MSGEMNRVLMALLASMCVLGVASMGLLIVTRRIILEELESGIRRVVGFVAIGLVAFYLVKTVLLPILIGRLVWLKAMTGWIAFAMLGVLASLTVLLLKHGEHSDE